MSKTKNRATRDQAARIRAAKARTLTTPTTPTAPPGTYWHGGAPGLQVGDELVAARELPILPVHYRFEDYLVCDPHLVYVTTDYWLGAHFATHFVDPRTHQPAPGDLYLVRPTGALGDDPDYPAGISYTCTSAVIEQVDTRTVRPTNKSVLASTRYATWDDGGPMYDIHGFAIPPQAARNAGITTADLTLLGIGPDPYLINQTCTVLIQRRGLNINDYVIA